MIAVYLLLILQRGNYMTIPKLLHYCWFGRKELSNSAKKNKDTWVRNCPDFKIYEWNEDNFDVNGFDYTRKQYKRGRYDLVSDFVRLFVIENYGGIYLDTDVEVLKPLNPLLNNNCFWGMEDFDLINSGLIFGSEAHYQSIRDLMEIYIRNSNDNGFLDMNCVKITTDYFRQLGFKYVNKTQNLAGNKIYSTHYFCPIKYGSRTSRVVNCTFTIHHYTKCSDIVRFHIIVGRIIRRGIGREKFERMMGVYRKFLT